MQVGLGGLADRVEKAMRPLWPALKAYAPCGTLALIDAEQPGKVGAARASVCFFLCFLSCNSEKILVFKKPKPRLLCYLLSLILASSPRFFHFLLSYCPPHQVMCLPPELPPLAIVEAPSVSKPSKKKKTAVAASSAAIAAASVSLASSSSGDVTNGRRDESSADLAGVAQRAFLDIAPSAPGDFVATQHAIIRYLDITGLFPKTD
jgi:hypothetical protein